MACDIENRVSIVSKRRNSPYRSGRSRAWVKMKTQPVGPHGTPSGKPFCFLVGVVSAMTHVSPVCCGKPRPVES